MSVSYTHLDVYKRQISWLRNKQVLRNKEKKGDSAMIRKIVQIEEDVYKRQA